MYMKRNPSVVGINNNKVFIIPAVIKVANATIHAIVPLIEHIV